MELLKEAEDSLSDWKNVHNECKEPADDLYYYAEELWVEDQKKWNEARHNVMKNKCSIEEFDEIVQALQQKQAPVWDILLKKEIELRDRLTPIHNRLKIVEQDIKKAVQTDPLTGKYINPLARLVGGRLVHQDQRELLHFYETKLHRQMQDAAEEFDLLCGFPSGTLTRVKNMRVNALKEATHLLETVHKKKHATPVAPSNSPAVPV